MAGRIDSIYVSNVQFMYTRLAHATVTKKMGRRIKLPFRILYGVTGALSGWVYLALVIGEKDVSSARRRDNGSRCRQGFELSAPIVVARMESTQNTVSEIWLTYWATVMEKRRKSSTATSIYQSTGVRPKSSQIKQEESSSERRRSVSTGEVSTCLLIDRRVVWPKR